MMDLLPGDYARVRDRVEVWGGHTGRVTWASDGHGDERVYDLEFVDDVPASTFCATELTAVSISHAEWAASSGAELPDQLSPVSTTRR